MLKLSATNFILAILQKWCGGLCKLANIGGPRLTQFLLLKQDNSCPSCFAQVQGGLTGSQLEGAAETDFLFQCMCCSRVWTSSFAVVLFLFLLAFLTLLKQLEKSKASLPLKVGQEVRGFVKIKCFSDVGVMQ